MIVDLVFMADLMIGLIDSAYLDGMECYSDRSKCAESFFMITSTTLLQPERNAEGRNNKEEDDILERIKYEIHASNLFIFLNG